MDENKSERSELSAGMGKSEQAPKRMEVEESPGDDKAFGHIRRDQGKSRRMVVDGVELKHCLTRDGNGCQRWLALDAFGVNKATYDGLSAQCRECVRGYQAPRRTPGMTRAEEEILEEKIEHELEIIKRSLDELRELMTPTRYHLMLEWLLFDK